MNIGTASRLGALLVLVGTTAVAANDPQQRFPTGYVHIGMGSCRLLDEAWDREPLRLDRGYSVALGLDGRGKSWPVNLIASAGRCVVNRNPYGIDYEVDLDQWGTGVRKYDALFGRARYFYGAGLLFLRGDLKYRRSPPPGPLVRVRVHDATVGVYADVGVFGESELGWTGGLSVRFVRGGELELGPYSGDAGTLTVRATLGARW